MRVLAKRSYDAKFTEIDPEIITLKTTEEIVRVQSKANMVSITGKLIFFSNDVKHN